MQRNMMSSSSLVAVDHSRDSWSIEETVITRENFDGIRLGTDVAPMTTIEHAPHKFIVSPDHPGRTAKRCAHIRPPNLISLRSIGTNPDDDKELFIRCNKKVTCIQFGYVNSQHLPTCSHRRKITSSESADQNLLLLISGHSDGHIYVWHGVTSELITLLVSHTNVVTEMLFAPPQADLERRPQILSVSHDGSAKLWEFEDNGYNMTQSIQHDKPLLCCAWSKDGSLIAMGGTGQKIYLHDYHKRAGRISGKFQKTLRHLHNVVALQFWPDGALLVSVSWDTTAKIWNVSTGEVIQTLCHYYPPPSLLFPIQVTGLAVEPKFGTTIATLADDGLLRLWDPMSCSTLNNINKKSPDPRCENVKPKVEEKVALENGSLSFSEDGKKLYVSAIGSGNVATHSVLLPVPTLKHLTRLRIRRSLRDMASLTYLPIPKPMISYLAYVTWT